MVVVPFSVFCSGLTSTNRGQLPWVPQPVQGRWTKEPGLASGGGREAEALAMGLVEPNFYHGVWLKTTLFSPFLFLLPSLSIGMPV